MSKYYSFKNCDILNQFWQMNHMSPTLLTLVFNTFTTEKVQTYF